MPTLARDWVESVLISGHNFMEWSIPIKCAMGFGFHMLVRILFLLWPPARGQLRFSPTISYIKRVPLVRTTTQYRIASGYADSASSISCTICWQYESRWPRQESSIRCTCLTPSIDIMPLSRKIIQSRWPRQESSIRHTYRVLLACTASNYSTHWYPCIHLDSDEWLVHLPSSQLP